MNHETDLATPPAPLPRTVAIQSEPPPPQAAPWRHDDSQSALPDRHAHVEHRAPEATDKLHRLPPWNAAMTVPARTGSLLSQISAMVPDQDSGPYSQASTRRSTPSTIRRMRRASATTHARAPAQIQEESPTLQGDRVPDAHCNDLDLYADCNGVVKDLCDETGQPLRILEARVASPAPQHEPVRPEGAIAEAARESHDGERPRYSTERPMSFIAGYADQDGKPQDQINRTMTPEHARIPPILRQQATQAEQHRPLREDTIYSDLPTGSLDPPQSFVPTPSSTPGTPPPKSVLRAIKSLDPTRPAKHAYIDQIHTSGGADFRDSHSQTQSTYGELVQNYHVSNVALHQPQAQRVAQIPHIIPDLRQGSTPSHASERHELEQGPENQQRLSQHEPQQPAQMPLHGTDNRHSAASAQSSVHDASKPLDKSSSKPKVSSMFKMFGGNGQANLQQQSSADSTTTDSNPPAGKQEHSKFFTSKKRQSSEQTSQDSQKSFFDLRKHKDPAALYSIPYHQFQSTANVPGRSGQSPQPAAAGASKPKRFYGLGAFFGKDGPSADSKATKLKLSSPKEDRKSEAARNHFAKAQVRREWDQAKGMYKPLQDQNSSQGQSPGQPVSEPRSEECSAFLSTKQIAEAHQAQQNRQHPLPVNNYPVLPGSLVHTQAARPDFVRQTPSDPPREYYNPHAVEDDRGAYTAMVLARQQHEQLQARRQMEQATHGQGNHIDPRYEPQRPQPQPSHPLPGQSMHQPWLGQNGTPRPDHGHPIQSAGPPEPRYEATPIPAAYSHVSGAYVAPSDRHEQHAYSSQHVQTAHPLPNHAGTQYADSGTPVVSPLMSPQSQVHPSNPSYPGASPIHAISPLSQSAPPHNHFPYPGVQRAHRPRMSSISEVQQQSRPWHLNLPSGATEQEIVRARQGQYMQDLFNAQQQQQAERAAGSPSPRTAPQHPPPTSAASQEYVPAGGFREILPTSPSHPYAPPHSGPHHYEQPLPLLRHPAYEQHSPVHSVSSPQPAAYPLPASRDSMRVTSPVDSQPRTPLSSTGPAFHNAQMQQYNGHQHHQNPYPADDMHQNPLDRAPQYDAQAPDEAPPSYDGIGVPNDGMDKSRPAAMRPPNINTDISPEDHGAQPGSRPRQPSIGILQHPQPASMAASPQRTAPDMGAESLRRQLLQQENMMQMERAQREQERRQALLRERQAREAARARARELERSVSSGGPVSSLHGGSASGWEPHPSRTRQVFELSALEDDEPVMKATSYPGQEWVPPMWDV